MTRSASETFVPGTAYGRYLPQERLMQVWWRRARLAGAWLVGLYLARLYVQMGWVKFDPEGFWTAAFARWGYPAWLRVGVGVAEVAGGVALVIPWIASYGAILVAMVMLGAWVTRAGDGRWTDVLWISAYLLALAWIGFEWWSRRLRLPARGTAT